MGSCPLILNVSEEGREEAGEDVGAGLRVAEPDVALHMQLTFLGLLAGFHVAGHVAST